MDLKKLVDQAMEAGQHVPKDARASWVLGWISASLAKDERERLTRYLTGAGIQ